MASTRFWMIGVAVFVVALSVLEAYHWDGGPEDNAKITACVGGSASFPWSIVTGRGETMLDRDWCFQAPGKDKTQIATYQHGHFYASNNESFAFLPNTGLSLHDIRPQDSGDYSVQVELRQTDSSFSSVGRTVTLSVTDRAPATQDGALHVTLSDTVRDDVTQAWTLVLYCGHFLDLGHPPVDVIWTTPSGEVRNSSYQNNGTFALSVSSPVHEGNYSCRLSPSAPAVRCLTDNSQLNASAQLSVDDEDVRFSFQKARQRELQQMIKDQAHLLDHQGNLIKHQALQISQLNKTIADMNYLLKPLSSANCVDWFKLDQRSGIRTVHISGAPIEVYCDQTTDNGGWIVFQRRQDASVDFYRGWTDYCNGFGDLVGNFWLGLDKLHKLTTSQRFELRVDLHKWDGTKGYATYSGFQIDDGAHNFTLHLDNFTEGNAGDSLSYHSGSQFTTKDMDNDKNWQNCAQSSHGAWWYNSCHFSNLNAEFQTISSGAFKAKGLRWRTFGNFTSMTFTEMKIRPV